MVESDDPRDGDPVDGPDREPRRVDRSIRYPDDPPDSFGRYLVGEAVGRGGAGTVYLATDVVLGREVALKVCRASVAADPEGRERFVNDARVASRLDHPGIVPVFDLSELPDGRPYFAMRRVVGESLAHALLSERPHDRRLDRDVLVDYLEVFRRVAETVAHAHEAGVIHGDLKPQNVMLGPEREVFVVDWGFARADFPAGSGEVVGGTVAYLAPETILARSAIDRRRGDVYGLGAILCEILTGAPPIRANTYSQARESFAEGESEARSPRFVGVDSDLAELANRCLAFDPSGRPENARKVANQVRDLLDSRRRAWRNAEVHAAAALERARAARRRTALWVALVASIGITLAVLGAVGVARVRGLELERQARRDAFESSFEAARTARREIEAKSAHGEPPAREAIERAVSVARDCLKIAVTSRLGSESSDRAGELLDALNRIDQRDRRLTALEGQLEEFRPHWSEANDHADLASQYARTFGAAGWRLGENDAEFLSEVVSSGRTDAIVSSIDSWRDLVGIAAGIEDASFTLLTAAANSIDPDPWRKEIRAAAEDETPARLLALALAKDIGSRPVRALLSLSARLEQRGEAIAARDLLRRVVIDHPAEAWLRHDLANLALDAEPLEIDLARVNFEAALALAPDSPHLMVDAARFEATHGEVVAAERLATRALALEPRSPRAEMLLAGLALGRGEHDRAIDHLERAAEIGWPAAVPALIETLFQSGRVVRALHVAESASERHPDSPFAWLQLGRLSIVSENHQGAVEALDRAIALDATDSRSLALSGFALANLGRIRESEERLARAEAATVPERDAPFAPVIPAARAIAERVERMNGILATSGDSGVLAAIEASLPEAAVDLGVALLAIERPDLALPAFEKAIAAIDELGPRRLAVIAALRWSARNSERRPELSRRIREWVIEETAIARRFATESGAFAMPMIRENLEVLALQSGLRDLRDEVALAPSLATEEREAWRVAFLELEAVITEPTRALGK